MQNQANQKMGDGLNVKMPLKECKDLNMEANVMMSRISNPKSDYSQTMKITTEGITGFDIEYGTTEETYKPKNFVLVAYATDKVCFSVNIDEEKLQKMLDYIKAERQKTYFVDVK